ncbi:MAG TPA: HAMP domain-containing sensor histidine kinase [Acidimicrobiales bacterium]|nr:HAMP domain-containing sensor histidine kinase [Acidimicrobiales bacterium]
MTFRSRVIAATVGVAAVAVIVASLSSFLATRNALLRSVDESLHQASLSMAHMTVGDVAPTTGTFFELVLANGQTKPPSSVPIDATIRSAATGHGGQVLRTVNFRGESYRELIIPLPQNSLVGCESGVVCVVSTKSAALLLVNITGQTSELRTLVRTLLFISAAGLLMALGLGLFIARTALHPLEEVTDEIEQVAETTDMSARIPEGGADELGRLRRVFNRLMSSVQNSQNQQRQLVLDASHELRTPLTSLRTNAQVLSRARELSDHDLHQISYDVVAQVDELAALVTDLGELTRGERSEGPVVALRLDEAVDECVDTARTHARVKDITIEAEVEPSVILGRHDRLVRAITNLLTNAVKFTPPGGRVRVICANGVLTVSDSGPGIALEDRPHVFDRFWRSASARGLPGSGLGLSIVAQVVNELGGTVTIDKDPDLGGARFRLTLPEGDEAS